MYINVKIVLWLAAIIANPSSRAQQYVFFASQATSFQLILTVFHRLVSDLEDLLQSFVGDPTIIADLAPAATNPALVSTLESYIQDFENVQGSKIPTAPPGFVTALPTAAQQDFSRVFVQELSVISADGGWSANSLVPMTGSSLGMTLNSSTIFSATTRKSSISSTSKTDSLYATSHELSSSTSQPTSTSLSMNVESTSAVAVTSAVTGGAERFFDVCRRSVTAACLIGVLALL